MAETQLSHYQETDNDYYAIRLKADWTGTDFDLLKDSIR
jgi:hypothetical protein